MTVTPTAHGFARRTDAHPARLAVAVAHQAHIAAGRAATVRELRHARAARLASDALADALARLERLILPDRAAWLAEKARRAPLPVAGTVTPAERAWVLGWHLLAAAARLHGGATQAGRPAFGERATAEAVVRTRQALGELESLVPAGRQHELRTWHGPTALRLDAQLALFAPVLSEPLAYRRARC